MWEPRDFEIGIYFGRDQTNVLLIMFDNYSDQRKP